MVDSWTVQEEKDLFISAFQLSVSGMAVMSTDGVFIRVNPALCRILGYSEEELVGMKLADVTHPDDLEYSLSFASKMLNEIQLQYQFEKRYRHRSGNTIWAYITASVIHSQQNSSKYFFTQVQDITERKEAEAAADRSNKLMIQTLESISDGFISLDSSGCFTYVNKAAEQFLGRSRYELLGGIIWDLFPELKQSEVYTEYLKAASSSEPSSYETYYAPLDRWLELHTHPSAEAFSVYFRDISDRKAAECKLRESDALYRMITEHSTDMISKHDNTGCYMYVSLACRALLGYEPDELHGRNIYDLIHPEDYSLVREGVLLLANQPDTTVSSYRIRRKNGEYIWFETTVRIIQPGTEGTPEYLCVSRDISIRKQAEYQLMQTNERLQMISKIDALTGISNRRHFDESYAKEWKLAARLETPLSIILLDIDYFKLYNDSYGHSEGDVCLRRVADALRKGARRPGDIIARYGGEEFVIILPITDEVGALVVAEQLRAEIERQSIPHGSSDVSPFVTISLGVATLVPTRELSPLELLIQADKALYQAKKEGRNRVVSHNASK
ncbi:sensor domain-containing diguanylate cyclase [Paenibacillus cremeus]|uniref:PAS domain S-box protein n=1 Tax=Paenibacillus cremeus TaxID=2163881 RepID=A0A559K3E5_9BACL|nr:sensor domain-containing diguanylate cyclase [Paenibacillus cremeus]TVY06663.1 PAS domain S-box protein [Paenibacillus cremeus]